MYVHVPSVYCCCLYCSSFFRSSLQLASSTGSEICKMYQTLKILLMFSSSFYLYLELCHQHLDSQALTYNTYSIYEIYNMYMYIYMQKIIPHALYMYTCTCTCEWHPPIEIACDSWKHLTVHCRVLTLSCPPPPLHCPLLLPLEERHSIDH